MQTVTDRDRRMVLEMIEKYSPGQIHLWIEELAQLVTNERERCLEITKGVLDNIATELPWGEWQVIDGYVKQIEDALKTPQPVQERDFTTMLFDGECNGCEKLAATPGKDTEFTCVREGECLRRGK